MRTIKTIEFMETTDPEPGQKAVVTYSDGIKTNFTMANSKKCDDPTCPLDHHMDPQEVQISLLYGMGQLMEEHDLLETGKSTQAVDISGYTH